MNNFMLTDILGISLACLFFPFILVAPGWLAGWFLGFWDFRYRKLLARLAMSMLLSAAISPILGFLLYRLVSSVAALAFFGLSGLACLVVLFRNPPAPDNSPEMTKYIRAALGIALGWSLLALLSLIDVQFGNRLYETVVAQDVTTRALVTDAIARTGVPPQNPGYYPGQPVPLTYLYYFWYILTSLVDLFGGSLVTSQNAMTASVIWCGLLLMALIAIYIRLRNAQNPLRARKLALAGIGLLLVSGLDFLPAGFFLYISRVATGSVWLNGDIEHWNEQITAWLGSLLWVPHHVAAFIACMTGLLLLDVVRGASGRTRWGGLLIAGLGFASAVGLSVWVTLVFVGFWMVQLASQIIEKEYRMAVWMIGAGVAAGLAILPFVLDLIHTSSVGGSGGIPLGFQVRRFIFTMFLDRIIPASFMPWLNLLVLPLNYFLELGFFLAAGWLWWIKIGRSGWKRNRFYRTELLLFLSAATIATFVRSTAIGNNDFGWRGWLFGQFILLIWGAEILFALVGKAPEIAPRFLGIRWNTPNSRKLLIPLLILGVITTLFDLALLRTWPILIDQNITAFPVETSPDAHLGERTYAARQAYEYIRKNTPPGWVVQYNPIRFLDRPAGLYGSHQMAIADISAYGVSLGEFEKMRDAIGAIFAQSAISEWRTLDALCDDYSINLLIISDTDGLWKSLPVLQKERLPLYQNDYYTLQTCGSIQK